MPLINPAWTGAAASERPFRWLRTEPGVLFDEADAARLSREFPTQSFVRREVDTPGSAKTYRNYSRALVGPDVPAGAPQLPEIWQRLVAELLDDGYRDAVAKILGQPPAAQLEIRLARHGRTDWLSPHTDRPDKAFSHLIYLNPQWHEEWGGCLQILASADPADVVAQVVPRLCVSPLFERTYYSWHQESAVAAAAPSDRISLLIHGRV
jgi:SM-20-related protein